MRRRTVRNVKVVASIAVLLVELLALHAAIAADAYPVKPVRIIVATGAGGVDDFTARQVAFKLSELLGQQFIVENHPGAGGMIGQTFVAKSSPDGYTLLLVLVVNPALPARSVKEFIELARSHQGRMTFGTLGAGQIPHWGAVLFNTRAGIDALEIPYKSSAEAITDVITGRIDYFFAPAVNAVGSKDKLRVLAVTTRVRSEMLPDVPTIAETALPGYDMPAWGSIVGPAGMNAEVVQILNKAIARSLASTDLRERFLKAGLVASASSPDELKKRYEDWMVIFGQIASDAGVKPH